MWLSLVERPDPSGRSSGDLQKVNTANVGMWLSLVERLVRDEEVGGSNPLIPTNSFFLYILWSPSLQRFYTGNTNSIDRRLAEHNSGLVASTRAGIPWELAYIEEFETKSAAVRRELEIKRWKSSAAIRQLIGG
jgi:putative endonuclease